MSHLCKLCGGACAGAELEPLLDERLAWLWARIAHLADRRGDADLADGDIVIVAPDDAEERAAGRGLVGGRPLKSGQRRRVDLAALAGAIRVRGANLTPGAVAAHAVGRQLATRSMADQARARLEAAALQRLRPAAELVGGEPVAVESALRRNGWLARITAESDPPALVACAVELLSRLPRDGDRIDRRLLASEVTASPHGLDDGTLLAGLALAILAAAGRVRPRQRPRLSWAEVGVDCDDVVGGLLVVGIVPAGWAVPPAAILTLPPRVLAACQWPPAPDPAWMFVTENPSVAAAAADLASLGHPVHLLCTMGTPSAREIDALARLAACGWRATVRADFDPAGLRHVAALLAGVPGAIPWRMSATDYGASVRPGPPVDRLRRLSREHTPWDPALAVAISASGIPAFEEALLERLIADLRRGSPNQD